MHVKEVADEDTNSLTTFHARATLNIYSVSDLFRKYVQYSSHHLDYRVNYFDKKNVNKADACKQTVPHLMQARSWLSISGGGTAERM